MNPDTKLPAAAPAHPTAVIGVMLSTDWPELAPRGPLRVLVTSNVKWAPHMLSLPGGKVDTADHAVSSKPADVAVYRELFEEVGLPTGASNVIPVWEGWTQEHPLHYVRAYRVFPAKMYQRLHMDALRAEEGARLVWIEPHLLADVCPYATTNMPAVQAACGMVELEKGSHER